MQTDRLTIALVGNPNTGKSTVFNALTGVRQRVGNYPGVTIAKQEGECTWEGIPATVLDLPGTYSMLPSPDEAVTVKMLREGDAEHSPPDVIVCVVDAGNLERNIYLVDQILELKTPVVVALNKMDSLAERGIEVDTELLSKRLGAPVIPMQAHRNIGLATLREMVFTTNALMSSAFERHTHQGFSLETETDEQLEARFEHVRDMLTGVVTYPREAKTTLTDQIDRILMHKLGGGVVFILVMAVVFMGIFVFSPPLSYGIELCFNKIADAITAYGPSVGLGEGALQSLIVDGILAGVGGVMVFLPQILMLFIFVAALEDCGYMARAAYLADGLLSRIGLSGKSFVPLLSSFACAVPGIMATRTIENSRDRLITILVAPLMSCSARLPVYILLIALTVPAGPFYLYQVLTMLALYLIGIVAAVAVAFILRKTSLKGEASLFVLELPGYKIPSIKTVGLRVWERCWSFLRQAGTVIVAVTVLVWAASYFPHTGGPQQLENSVLGQAGKVIEPAVEPLGWDWRIGCAVIASFPAREIFVSTMGVIYGVEEEENEEEGESSPSLPAKLAAARWGPDDSRRFNAPVSFSLLVFYALCAQCAATLIVIWRETDSWRWAAFTFAYMTILAYVAALLTFQIGSLFVSGGST